MEDRFYELIIILRHRRKELIQQLINKDIYIANKNFFEYLDYLQVYYDHQIVPTKMEVRVNAREVYIYYNNDIDSINRLNYSRSYFSIIDIYEGLRKVSNHTKKKLLKVLEKGMIIESKVEYRNDFYMFKSLELVFSKRNVVFIDERKLEINQLLLTLSLIQFKSNAFFYRSSSQEYMNGIIRLLYVLLSHKKDHPILLSKQWKYNKNQKKYDLYRDRISAIYLVIKDDLDPAYLSFVEEIKRCDSIDCVEHNFINLYNETNKVSLLNISNLQNGDIIDLLATEVSKDKKIKSFLLNNVKKGLYEIKGETIDDIKDSYNYECKNLEGDNYIYLVLSTYREFEYYLTTQQKESII